MINRGFSVAEMVVLLEKHGAKLSIRKQNLDAEGIYFTSRALVIGNAKALDPELVNLLWERENEAIDFLSQRASYTVPDAPPDVA